MENVPNRVIVQVRVRVIDFLFLQIHGIAALGVCCNFNEFIVFFFQNAEDILINIINAHNQSVSIINLA